MRRLLVNDQLTCIPGTRTFWHDLVEWFDMEFVGGEYGILANRAEIFSRSSETQGWPEASLIIRNASWFQPIKTTVSQIALVQDIMESGPGREMQEAVLSAMTYGVNIRGAAVFNSAFTRNAYASFLSAHDKGDIYDSIREIIIPLPVNADVFQPGNPMGLRAETGLPDRCVCWVGSQNPIKGFDIFMQLVRDNPDISFAGVFKDAVPEVFPPNLRVFPAMPQEELAKLMGACRVGLCTSRMESQHLAGIEMGMCGLPLVVPPVGTYWNRADIPGIIVEDLNYAGAIRQMMQPKHPGLIREYWQKEFAPGVVKFQWEKLITEVENAG